MVGLVQYLRSPASGFAQAQASYLCWLATICLGVLLLTCPSTSIAEPPCPNRSLVIVVNGAGGFEVCASVIYQVVAEDRLPLDVVSYRWTHGYLRIPADQMDAAHMARQGQRLAEYILACRRTAPERPVFLLGHSAGCGLVLCAAEQLPPQTLEGIVLLAPAVSSEHDLRPVLASVCRSVDVYISHRDWFCLSIGTLLAGTTDRCFTFSPAGRVGFRPILTCAADVLLYGKLRQFLWDPCLRWTGNKGGHYGAHQPGFLRHFVLPVSLSTAPKTP